MFFPFRSNFILTLLRKISLFQFKNYNEQSFILDFPITCISGNNGSGKTNLLDAIYILCYTKSYFSSLTQQMIRNGSDGCRIDGFFNRQEQAEHIVCKIKNGKKEISSNKVTYEKYADHIGKYTAVMIAPDDIALINEGSEIRRKLLDTIIGQCNKDYLNALMRYQKTLQQRNAWLKLNGNLSRPPYDQLAFYDQVLSETGDFIYHYRRDFIRAFFPLLEKYYRTLSFSQEATGIRYESDLESTNTNQLLAKQLSQDMRFQRTLRGIHKDELLFTIDDMPLKGFGSQGQKKSFLFAIKLAQFEYIQQQLGESPILLLDDVFEKLDQERMQALFRILKDPSFHQIFITDTHQQRLEHVLNDNKNFQTIRL